MVLGLVIGAGGCLLVTQLVDSTTGQALSDRQLTCAAMASMPADFGQRMIDDDFGIDDPALFRLGAITQLGQGAERVDEQRNADIGEAARDLNVALRELDATGIADGLSVMRDVCK